MENDIVSDTTPEASKFGNVSGERSDSSKNFEILVFRVVQDRAVAGFPNVRPDVDEIVAAHEAIIKEAVSVALEAVLNEFNLDTEDKDELVARINAYRGRL